MAKPRLNSYEAKRRWKEFEAHNRKPGRAKDNRLAYWRQKRRSLRREMRGWFREDG